jgi:uncharacterized membrane protein YqiK
MLDDPISLGLFILACIAIILFLIKGVKYIDRYQVGITTRKILGEKMPQGQVIARKGEIGIQADTLMPGLYWFNPFIWTIETVNVTTIGKSEVGVVESIDGLPIPTGRLLGDEVESNQFQDAKMFLDNNGKKGPQVAILRPGVYRINTRAFTITNKPVTKIDTENVGIVEALDGKPLPSEFIIAPKPTNGEHNYYQNSQAFINSNGYRGPQLETLQPGEYYINPLLFNIKQYEVAEVPPGYVVVLRSNIGVELAKSGPVEEFKKGEGFGQKVHEKDEVVLTTDITQRGIWEKPIAPGVYNLNYLALTPYKVPTSAITIDWAGSTDIRTEEEGTIEKTVNKIVGRKTVKSEHGEEDEPPKEEIESEKATEFFRFSQLTLTSKDGFTLEADVRLIIRIRPQHASFVIARFGSVTNLIEQIVHPLIDSSFRNKAGEKKAIEFIQERTRLQQEALEKAQTEFEKYYIDAQNLLISYIKVDPTLLKTQTDKEIAIQQQQQYQEQAKAQEENIAVQEKSARAAKQKDVIDATLSIQINTDKAEALIKEAEGKKQAAILVADGQKYANAETGKGTAEAYEAQAKVVGPERLAFIKIMEQVSAGQVKIVPDLSVSGDGQGGNLFNTWIATMLAKQVQSETAKSKKENVKEDAKEKGM